MTTHQNTTRKHRIRSTLRYIWQDTTNANRALFRLPPYDDYLQNNRRATPTAEPPAGPAARVSWPGACGRRSTARWRSR